MVMIWELVTVLFFGASMGSFLNVVIDRLPYSQPLGNDRSRCDHCKKVLRWYELIPVFSYVAQKGCCLRCGKKLSWQYPLLEIITALLTFLVLAVNHAGVGMPVTVVLVGSIIVQLAVVYILIVVFMIDLKTMLIPDQLTVGLVAVFILETVLEMYRLGMISGLQGVFVHILTALSAGGFFLLLILFTRGKGMGMGDLKLAAGLGLLLSPVQTIIALYAAFLLGGGCALSLLMTGRTKFGKVIPFGPFIALGGVLAILYTPELLKLYLTIFG